MASLAVARCPALVESAGAGPTLGGRGAGCSTWGGGKGAGWQGSGCANPDRSHQLLTRWCKSCGGGEGSGRAGAELALALTALSLPPPLGSPRWLCPVARTLPAADRLLLRLVREGFPKHPPQPLTRGTPTPMQCGAGCAQGQGMLPTGLPALCHTCPQPRGSPTGSQPRAAAGCARAAFEAKRRVRRRVAGDSGVLAAPSIGHSQTVGRASTSLECPCPWCLWLGVPTEGQACSFGGQGLQDGTGLLQRDALHPGSAHCPLSVGWLQTHGASAGASPPPRSRGVCPDLGARGCTIRPSGTSIPKRGASPGVGGGRAVVGSLLRKRNKALVSSVADERWLPESLT